MLTQSISNKLYSFLLIAILRRARSSLIGPSSLAAAVPFFMAERLSPWNSRIEWRMVAERIYSSDVVRIEQGLEQVNYDNTA